MSGAQIWMDSAGMLPEIIIAVFALFVLTLDFLKISKSHETFAFFSLTGVLLAMIFSVRLWGQEMSLFSGSVAVDLFSVCFKLICLTISSMVILISVPYLKKANMARGEYYSLLLFATLGMMIIADGIDIITIYLGLELLGISSYILTAFMVDDKKSGEAAIKYFILGALASTFLVYGMSLLYGMTGQTNIYEIQRYLSQVDLKSDPGLMAALILLITGFGFKIGMVPFHMWLPDVYEGAPTPVSAFIATGSKVAPVAAIIRVFIVAIGTMSGCWVTILAILAAATMTLGNFLALRQENLKRMLAYSGITHIGYVLMGLVAAGTSRNIGLTSVVFYFIVYMLANVGAFGILIYISGKSGRNGEHYADIKGLGKVSPMLAILMSIFIFSMLGVPPTGGFVGKVWLFASAVKTNMIWLAAVGVINAVISAYYYLRVLVMMYMHEPAENHTFRESPSHLLSAALVIMAIITVYMGLNPGAFFDFAQSSLRLFL